MEKIKVGDEVQVITGKDKGKRGLVKARVNDRLVVDGVNVLVKHKTGGTVTQEGTIHISNVLPYDATSGKASRVGFRIANDKKVRFLKKSGQLMQEKGRVK